MRDLEEKLRILGAAARYDASCSSGGSHRAISGARRGSCRLPGICHSWSDDGRCVSLLKILLTNQCVYDCAYCANRSSREVPRESFTSDEVADLTVNFYRRNYVEGLFLSSSVKRSPDHTMEQLLLTVKKLREEYGFKGYIHVKAIPGSDHDLIREACRYADRISVNIELPTEKSLRLLAPQKSKEDILGPMGRIHSDITANREERRKFVNAPSYAPAGQTTQLIVGATPENDLQIISLAEDLYNKYRLKRIYYSAFIPVSPDPRLPQLASPPLLREHRLYQADWLLRYYGFSSRELLDDCQPNLDEDMDPKSSWALRNLHFFPVEINIADYETLLRVPGIGVKSARRIVHARKFHSLGFEDLQKIGVVLKRAKYFITCRGRYFHRSEMDGDLIREKIRCESPAGFRERSTTGQLSLFEHLSADEPHNKVPSSITGEL